MAQLSTCWTKSGWRDRYSVILPSLFTKQRSRASIKLLLPVVIAISTSPVLRAQVQTVAESTSSSDPQSQSLPDAPTPPQQNSQTQTPPWMRRYGQLDEPMDLGDKFKFFIEPAFGPRAIFSTAVRTGIRMADPPKGYPEEWHSGIGAYGRLYGDSFARNGAESIGRFSTATLLHEDPRYRRSASTFVPMRIAHALSYTFVDRTDGGSLTPAISNFAGAAANGFVGNLYLPTGFDNLTHAGQRSVAAFGGLAGQNLFQEFAPDLGHALRKIHVPHIPLPPVWWTGDK